MQGKIEALGELWPSDAYNVELPTESIEHGFDV
jgi:hypothetical protein